MKRKRSKDGWLRIVDNHSRWYGDTDEDKKIIRVNKSKKKNKERGDILNTIVHEEMHAAHPQMHERTVRTKTKKKIKSLSIKQKKKLYLRYREGGR